MLRYISLALLSLALVFSVAVADDVTPAKKGKKGARKGPNPATAVMKRLEQASIELTEQQTAAIQSHADTMMAAAAKIRKEHNLNAESMKAIREAKAAAREEGLKGPAIEKAAMEKVDLSDEQRSAVKEIASLQQQFTQNVKGELTEEQIAKLPKGFGGGKAARGNAKKKKKE